MRTVANPKGTCRGFVGSRLIPSWKCFRCGESADPAATTTRMAAREDCMLGHSSGGKISMAKSNGAGERRAAMHGCWEDRRCGRREESRGSIWADSHESLNRCFTMAFCFACFIEQRADIHVNLALLQSARTSRGCTRPLSHPRPPSSLLLPLFFPYPSSFFFCYSLWISGPLPIFHKTFSITRRRRYMRATEAFECLEGRFYRVID